MILLVSHSRPCGRVQKIALACKKTTANAEKTTSTSTNNARRGALSGCGIFTA